MYQTNQNTSLLKLIACLAMLVDHVGVVFFPLNPIFHCIGRIAFPIFCYCLTVGLQYTRNSNRYLLRLGLFAVLSQPFYVLAFHPGAFWENIGDLNIFFTLLFSLLALVGLQEKKWWLLIFCVVALGLGSFDYSADGIILVVIFYLCRSHPGIGAALFVLNYLPVLFTTSGEDPLSIIVAGHPVGCEIFALLALPLILVQCQTNWKISKWVFYLFYPLHLLAICTIRQLIM